MVPPQSRGFSLVLRFPRASGDGPEPRRRFGLVGRFPPRERGWSHYRSAGEVGCRVSPARAGMVRCLAFDSFGSLSFPRASGDGPDGQAIASTPPTFPPRERGWSPRSSASISSVDVSPARAGMVPAPVKPQSWRPCFPRASGDGPRKCDSGARLVLFPPRERGWSPVGRPGICPRLVSPARAGMVPSPPPRPRTSRRFPRASGDGPILIRAAVAHVTFPPRERGWSPAPDAAAGR